ncbi:Cytochrome P450 2C38, partial [Cricetulus griseus]
KIMSEFDSSAILSLLGLILIFILNIKVFMAKAYKLQSPPGPKPWPVIGNLHILNLKRPYQTMLELSKKYGSIYSIHMGPRKVVVLSGYETVKDALVKYGNQFEERSRVPIFERLFNGKGKPFEIKKVLNASVANVIVSVLFGKRFDYQDPQFLRLLTLIGENVKLIGSSRIVENDISADYFNEENLLALVSNLFAAGTETTATTLRWGVTLMMRYPEVQEKVHDEIVKVVGSAQPRIEHRTQMPYTDAVVHEIQRFADILPTSLPHETTTDVIFKNYYIPKVRADEGERRDYTSDVYNGRSTEIEVHWQSWSTFPTLPPSPFNSLFPCLPPHHP